MTEKRQTTNNKSQQQNIHTYWNDWAKWMTQNTKAMKTPHVSPQKTPNTSIRRTPRTASPTKVQLIKTIQTTPTKTKKTAIKQDHMTVTKTNTKKKNQDITNTKMKTSTITTKRKTSDNKKYANHPDYEYDTMKNRWVKKSDLRPAELVNRYKAYLSNYLKKYTTIVEKKKEIEKLVKKHATSTNQLKKLLVEKKIFSQDYADKFFHRINFWKKELCHHMKKVCLTETDLEGHNWCQHPEDAFFYFKGDGKNKVSCFSVGDLINIISSSLTGGDEETIFLQLPRDPYTRKVLSQEFIKTFLKQLRLGKERLNKFNVPHVVYFLRNYKKFYSDPTIKSYLNKTTLTNKEKWELSEAIEEFMTATDEIEHDLLEESKNDSVKESKRWWFWVDEKNPPTDIYGYIFNT